MKTQLKALLKGSFFLTAGLPAVRRRFFRYRGPLGILNYHRIGPAEVYARDVSPNRGMMVSVERFAEQMAHVAQRYPVISMDEVPDHLASGSKVFKLAVTFDDGYRDNLEHALPVLQRYGIPATVYVATRLPEGEAHMWWYELWEILGRGPAISFEWEGTKHSWDTSTHGHRSTAFAGVRSLLLALRSDEQLALMAILRSGAPARSYAGECLTWDEIAALDREPLVTIGSHTHTHPNLRNCTPEDLTHELTTSKQLLERHLGHEIRHLAYPFGGAGETDERVYEAAKACEYATAVTTRLGVVSGSQPHSMPRLVILEHHDRKRLDLKLSGMSVALGRAL